MVLSMTSGVAVAGTDRYPGMQFSLLAFVMVRQFEEDE
jgi:hypothetical protein